ncbi:transglutaminase family protein, partial [Nitrospirota bacterium]
VPALEYFLFNTRTGYCQYFASTMAVMLRTLGIQSRIVTGFLGGETTDEEDYFLVRQNNAHSWVEAYINNAWRRYDPTPIVNPFSRTSFAMTFEALRMQWYRYVVGFSSADQRMMVSSLYMPKIRIPEFKGIRISLSPLSVVSFLAIALILSFLLFRKHKRRQLYSEASKLYIGFIDEIRKRGGQVHGNFTSGELLKEAIKVNAVPDKAGLFIKVYEQVRFGNRTLGDEERSILHQADLFNPPSSRAPR